MARKDAGTWWCDCERLKEVTGASCVCRKVLLFCLEPLAITSTSPHRCAARVPCASSLGRMDSGVGSLTPIPSYAPYTVIKYCITRFAQDNQLLQPHALFCSPAVAAICQTDSVTPPSGNRFTPRSNSPKTKTAQLPSAPHAADFLETRLVSTYTHISRPRSRALVRLGRLS